MEALDAHALRSRIYARTSELAGVPREEISAETTLDGAGLDSSDAVILALEVEELVGAEIDVGVFLRFKTLGESIDELVRLLTAKAA
jgi:acyl carrier protein